jgi:hypothetical protein
VSGTAIVAVAPGPAVTRIRSAGAGTGAAIAVEQMSTGPAELPRQRAQQAIAQVGAARRTGDGVHDAHDAPVVVEPQVVVTAGRRCDHDAFKGDERSDESLSPAPYAGGSFRTT